MTPTCRTCSLQTKVDGPFRAAPACMLMMRSSIARGVATTAPNETELTGAARLTV